MNQRASFTIALIAIGALFAVAIFSPGWNGSTVSRQVATESMNRAR
jgi:hypothetical protein